MKIIIDNSFLIIKFLIKVVFIIKVKLFGFVSKIFKIFKLNFYVELNPNPKSLPLCVSPYFSYFSPS